MRTCIDEFKVNGDIVLTDPRYIKSDWKLLCKHCTEARGGDCILHVFELKPDGSKTEIGKCGSDSGEITVEEFNFNECNEEFKKWLETHKHCATVIENFNGTIEYSVEKTCEYAYDFQIHGKGMKNGEEFEFTTISPFIISIY